MDYVPDWSEQSYRTAAYPYAAPDAPDMADSEEEWNAHADDWEECTL